MHMQSLQLHVIQLLSIIRHYTAMRIMQRLTEPEAPDPDGEHGLP
jgi:hypothetical protein